MPFCNSIDNYIFARRLLNRAGTADSTNAARDRIFRYAQTDAALLGRRGHPRPAPTALAAASRIRSRWCVPEQLNAPAEDQHYLPFIPGDRLQSGVRVSLAAKPAAA